MAWFPRFLGLTRRDRKTRMTSSKVRLFVESLESRTLLAGDPFLSSTVGAITSSRAWKGNSVIFIMWDESEFTNSGFGGFGDDSGCCDSVAGQGGGHVAALVISHSNDEHVTSSIAYNHYSVLRTIQQGWRLGCLGFTCDTKNVPTMSKLTSSED